MKRLLASLANIKLGVYLLLAASAVLFVGSITADVYSTEFRTLNFMHLPVWFGRHLASPVMYLWMPLLFCILAVLALNTLACIVTYFHSIFDGRHVLRRTGILLFHASFLLCLLGHCLYEFTGTTDTLTLEKGIHAESRRTGLALAVEDIARQTIQVNGTTAPIHTAANLLIRHDDGTPVAIRPASMQPACALGYTFHIAMHQDSNPGNTIKIIVRKDYGLYALAAGGVMTLIAILLYALSALRSRPDYTPGHQYPK